MSTVNKVILIGRLGRDPELRQSGSGTSVCNLSLATDRTRKDGSGEKIKETEWHRVVLFDRLGDIANDYLSKGRSVYIEGRLCTRKWTDKDGVEKYTTEIVGEQMQLLGGGEDRQDGDPAGPPSAAPRQPQKTHGERQQERAASFRDEAPRRPPPSRSAPAKSGTGFDDMDDDIPF